VSSTVALQRRSIWPNSFVLTIDCDLRCIRTTCTTTYKCLDDVAHPLTARFVVVLKHFYSQVLFPLQCILLAVFFVSFILLLGALERRMGAL